MKQHYFADHEARWGNIGELISIAQQSRLNEDDENDDSLDGSIGDGVSISTLKVEAQDHLASMFKVEVEDPLITRIKVEIEDPVLSKIKVEAGEPLLSMIKVKAEDPLLSTIKVEGALISAIKVEKDSNSAESIASSSDKYKDSIAK